MGKNAVKFLAITLVALVACCCHKTKVSSASGIVTDKASGLPLAGARVNMAAAHFNGNSESIESGADTTGTDGHFSVMTDSERAYRVGFLALKEGYMTKPYKEMYWGQDLEYDFEMYPIDAVLNVTTVNETGSLGFIYARLGGVYYENSTAYFYPWPLSIPLGDDLHHSFKVPGGQFVRIYWGSNADHVKWVSDDIRIDSVFCSRNDTTEFILKF